MIGIHHSYYWYMTCFDSSSQAVLSFSLCFTRPSLDVMLMKQQFFSASRVYEPFPVPTLYVGRTEDHPGRVPLFPCFLHGNATSTIPYHQQTP